jgi:hypothetical protein
MYGAEFWTVSRTNERALDVFEKKILHRIYGPVQDKGQWRSRYNKELYDLFKEPRLSITIRIASLRLAGHVRRIDEEALPRRIMYVTPIGQRKTETKSTLKGGSWKGCENVRNKELMVYSYEQRRMEVTFKGGQDSYRVVEPMMMVMKQVK